MRSCRESLASTIRDEPAMDGRVQSAPPRARITHARPLPSAQYRAPAQGMRREMSRTKHARISPAMIPPVVQRNRCCRLSRLRQGCSAAVMLPASRGACEISAIRDGIKVAIKSSLSWRQPVGVTPTMKRGATGCPAHIASARHSRYKAATVTLISSFLLMRCAAPSCPASFLLLIGDQVDWV